MTTKIGTKTLTRMDPNRTDSQLSSGPVYFTWNGHPMQVELRETAEHASSPWGRQQRKARAYVYIVEEIPNDFLQAIADMNGLETIYVNKGECKELDAAWKKFNKAEVNQMTGILEAGLAALGLSEVKFRYSTKAGCACGCSPGFIAQTTEILQGHFNIFFFNMEAVAKYEAERAAKLAAKEIPSRFALIDN